MSQSTLGWIAYGVFAALALALNWHDGPFAFDGAMPGAKVVVWMTYAAFLVFSLYCSAHENIFKTVDKILAFHWGRQISLDLYLGLGLAMFVIYLHEGALAVALWLVPTLAFANLSILLYVAIHFDGLVQKLIS